ncbi:MAG: hypothetical protein N3B15_06335 [Planctomycetota bacterium]|nr:hypothetical protein [Planctomycetota bacterium]
MRAPPERFRARPRGRQWALIAGFALLSGAAGAWMTQALAIAPLGWPLPTAVGLGLALACLAVAAQGTALEIHPDGTLVYHFYGRPQLRLQLADVRDVRPVRDGWLVGVGLELVDPQRVIFLHRAGLSPARLQRWRQRLGVDLVLEGFDERVAARIAALRNAPAPPSGP